MILGSKLLVKSLPKLLISDSSSTVNPEKINEVSHHVHGTAPIYTGAELCARAPSPKEQTNRDSNDLQVGGEMGEAADESKGCEKTIAKFFAIHNW